MTNIKFIYFTIACFLILINLEIFSYYIDNIFMLLVVILGKTFIWTEVL